MADDKVEKAIKKFSEKGLGDVKVLMVEDDNFFSELVLSKLSEQGCIPYSTGNGEEAVSLARQYCPDVMILDLMLPGLQGEAVLKELKSDDELQGIPVIVFSNKSNPEDVTAVMGLGAAEFLIKSTTDLNELTEVVRNVLESKK